MVVGERGVLLGERIGALAGLGQAVGLERLGEHAVAVLAARPLRAGEQLGERRARRGLNEQELRVGFTDTDTNRNGRINIDEFRAWWLSA